MERLENIPGRWAAIRPDAPALVDALGSRTWAELEGAIATLSSRLRRHGVLAGDRVMIVGENSAVMVALLFAVSALDAWIVNVNARLSAREIEAIRDHSQPRCMLFLVEASPDAALHAARADTGLLETDGWGMVLMTPADGQVAAEAPAGVAALVYTTGTTSEPKGVMLTHANLLFVARAAVSLRGLTATSTAFRPCAWVRCWRDPRST
jgi:long-chain acyl-CoA synthetase